MCGFYLIRPKQGKVLVMLGPDGSGKSSISEELIELNHASNFSGVEIFHFRPFRNPSIGSLVTSGKGVVAGGRPYVSKPRSLFGSFIKLLYYVIEYNYGYFVNIYPLLHQNKLVIFDRHFLDLGLDPERARMKLPDGLVEFFNKFIPQPDLFVFLVGDAQILSSRKDELTIEETETLLGRYSGVAERLGVKFDTTNTPPSKTAERILAVLLHNSSE